LEDQGINNSNHQTSYIHNRFHYHTRQFWSIFIHKIFDQILIEHFYNKEKTNAIEDKTEVKETPKDMTNFIYKFETEEHHHITS
jgi:hypothetical protein